MNSLAWICLLIVALTVGATAYQAYRVFTLPLPQHCTFYTTKNPTSEGDYQTAYGTICRNKNGDWIVRK